MSTDTISWVGQTLGGGRYKVTGKLGEGGMGFVYKAHDANLDTDVVIKVPRGGLEEASLFVARFGREIKALVQLQHPHIVRVMDYGQHEGLPFAVIQYLPGGSLHDRRPIGADGLPVPILWNELGGWLIDIAEALDFIHRQGYVHRDLKPANILFDAYGNVFLGDFGIAKVLGSADNPNPSAAMTAQGMIVGTPEYMAPELVMGQSYDGRVDQYALAVLLYELLAGRRPFSGPTPWAVLVQHKTTEAPVLNEKFPFVPKAVAAAIKRAMAKDPAQRYADCGTFARAVLSASPVADTPGGSPRPAAQTGGPGPGAAAPTDPASLRVTCPACMKVFRVKQNLQGKKVRCPNCKAIAIVPFQITAEPGDLSNALVPTAKAVETPPMLQPVPADLPPPRGLDDILLWPFLGTLIGANFLAMFLPLLVQQFTVVAMSPERIGWVMLTGGILGMLLGVLGVSFYRWPGNLLRMAMCLLGLALPMLLLYPDVLNTNFTRLGERANLGKLALLGFEALLILITIYGWVRVVILWKRRPPEGETSVWTGNQRLQVWLGGLASVMVLLIGGVMALQLGESFREAAPRSAALKWFQETLTRWSQPAKADKVTR
jgi:serine/threonine-protein kinase